MIIDVSKYNVVEDWKQVKSSVSGVILRCGYRGYGSGKIVEDAKFKQFAAVCRKNGIPFGLYFMSQAINAAEGKEEAKYSAARAMEYGATLPIFIDSEDGDGTARIVRADGLSKDVRTEIVKAFCDTATDAGFRAGIYASEYWYQEKLHYGQLKDRYIIWVAKYGKNTGTKTSVINLEVCHMHQYTSKGRVAGINGYVDVSEGDVKNLLKETPENTQAASTEPAGEAPEHIQLDYQPQKSYKIVVDGLRIRTKTASQSPLMLPNAEIIGITEKGATVKNLATARVGDQIWMYIGLDGKGREQWICADTGYKTYVK